jgi:ABC-type sugar transport system ATPase subunit
MATVTFDHVTKRYDGTVAVNDLSLGVQDGEFLVLVGPSGCGKTTALRMVAGLEPITDGRLLIGERVVNNVAPVQRDIAMVFQSYALYPHFTVYNNLAFGLRNKKVPRKEIDERVKQAADILDLGPLLKRKPKQLSGGQRQRVALGRAIVREPSAFLMDEPLSNLDAKLRVQTRGEILKLQDRLDVTTIYVTHDQVEAMTMGDRIAVMNLGVLQQVGTPEELYENPSNMFVAGFIGSPAMNLVPASLLSAGGGDRIVGFRPEHVDVGGNGDGLRVSATVDVVEYLGDEQIVHMRVKDTPIVAKLPVEERLAARETAEFFVARTSCACSTPRPRSASGLELRSSPSTSDCASSTMSACARSSAALRPRHRDADAELEPVECARTRRGRSCRRRVERPLELRSPSSCRTAVPLFARAAAELEHLAAVARDEAVGARAFGDRVELAPRASSSRRRGSGATRVRPLSSICGQSTVDGTLRGVAHRRHSNRDRGRGCRRRRAPGGRRRRARPAPGVPSRRRARP